MNSLIFLILVIMALYTLIFFYFDMLAFLNTRHSFAEGFTSNVIKTSKPIFKGTWQEEDTAMYPGKGIKSSETSSHHSGTFQPKTVKSGGVGTYEECKESCSKRPHCLGFEWNNFDQKGSCYMMDNWEYNGQSFRLLNNEPASSLYGKGRTRDSNRWKGAIKVYDLYYKDIFRLNGNRGNVSENKSSFLEIFGGGRLSGGKTGFSIGATPWDIRPQLRNRAWQILSTTGKTGFVKNGDEVYICCVATNGRKPITHGYISCRKDLGLRECNNKGYEAHVVDESPDENCKWIIRLVNDSSSTEKIKTNSTVIFISKCDNRFMLQTCNKRKDASQIYIVSVGNDGATNTSGSEPQHQWKISTV